MPKVIEFEGKQHEFPDDFTDADISTALSKVSNGAGSKNDKPIGGSPISRTLGAAFDWLNPTPLLSIGSDLATAVAGHGQPRMDAAGRLLTTAKDSIMQNWDLATKGWESLKTGRYADAFQKLTQAPLPVIGPAMNQVTEEVVSGQYPEAIGHTMALGAPAAIKATGRAAKAVAAPIARELRDSSKRSYTRAINPYQLNPSGRLSVMAKKAVEGIPASPTGPAVPGLIERGVIAPTQSSLQSKITSMTDKLAADLDDLHASIPEGTLALPINQVFGSIRQRIKDRFTIQPQGKKPIPSSPDSISGIGLSKQFENLIRAAAIDVPVPRSPGRQTSGYSAGLGKKTQSVTTPGTPGTPGVQPPPSAGALPSASPMDMVPTESGWIPIPANLGYGSLGAPTGAAASSASAPKFMGTVNAASPKSGPTPTIKVVDFQILRRFKQAWDRSVAEAGGYAGNDFINNMKRATYREVANAVRDELNTARPDIAKVGKEFHFWKTAQDVIDSTVERTKSRQAPLSQNMMTAAGMAKGGVGVALLLRNLTKLTQSTGWNTTSAVLKDRLANLIEAGDIRGANAMLVTLAANLSTGTTSEPLESRKGLVEPMIAGKPGDRRISPVGSVEVVNSNLRPGASATTSGNVTNYSPDFWNDPVTQSHERIHVGQHRLGATPPTDRVNNIFQSTDFVPNPQVYERPAYALSDLGPSGTEELQADSLATTGSEYINLLKRLGMQSYGINTIEAALPSTLLRSIIRRGVPPPPGYVNPIINPPPR